MYPPVRNTDAYMKTPLQAPPDSRLLPAAFATTAAVVIVITIAIVAAALWFIIVIAQAAAKQALERFQPAFEFVALFARLGV